MRVGNRNNINLIFEKKKETQTLSNPYKDTHISIKTEAQNAMSN